MYSTVIHCLVRFCLVRNYLRTMQFFFTFNLDSADLLCTWIVQFLKIFDPFPHYSKTYYIKIENKQFIEVSK